MDLSKEAIEEFKSIYFKQFGETISDREAIDLGESLIRFFEIIYRPIPKDYEYNSEQPTDEANK